MHRMNAAKAASELVASDDAGHRAAGTAGVIEMIKVIRQVRSILHLLCDFRHGLNVAERAKRVGSAHWYIETLVTFGFQTGNVRGTHFERTVFRIDEIFAVQHFDNMDLSTKNRVKQHVGFQIVHIRFNDGSQINDWFQIVLYSGPYGLHGVV